MWCHCKTSDVTRTRIVAGTTGTTRMSNVTGMSSATRTSDDTRMSGATEKCCHQDKQCAAGMSAVTGMSSVIKTSSVTRMSGATLGVPMAPLPGQRGVACHQLTVQALSQAERLRRVAANVVEAFGEEDEARTLPCCRPHQRCTAREVLLLVRSGGHLAHGHQWLRSQGRRHGLVAVTQRGSAPGMWSPWLCVPTHCHPHVSTCPGGSRGLGISGAVGTGAPHSAWVRGAQSEPLLKAETALGHPQFVSRTLRLLLNPQSTPKLPHNAPSTPLKLPPRSPDCLQATNCTRKPPSLSPGLSGCSQAAPYCLLEPLAAPKLSQDHHDLPLESLSLSPTLTLTQTAPHCPKDPSILPPTHHPPKKNLPPGYPKVPQTPPHILTFSTVVPSTPSWP